MVRACLKGSDGTLVTLRDVISIGRGNCDLIIKHPGVDYEHCKIDYSEQDGCYVLQDLNTSQGTYVNDVRVQNAAVRLAPGDLIRFGSSGQTFELAHQNEPQVHIPPVCQRPPIWNQPPTILTEAEPYNVYAAGGIQSFPHIASVTSIPHTSHTWSHLQSSQPPPVPRPPLRSRPLSAGAARRNIQNMPVGPTNGVIGGWMKPTEQPLMRASSIPDLQDKDLKISQLNQEVTNLRNIELEAMRKDTVIQQQLEEIAELRMKVRQEPSYLLGGDVDVSAKLLFLETEVSIKKEEIGALKKQLDKFQDDKGNSPALLRQELGERVKEICQLRTDLERVKKDKGIISGLVTQMQREMSNKDSTVSRLTRELEVLKKDIREREIHASSFKNTKEVTKASDESIAKDKELSTLRQKLRTAENKLQVHVETVTELRQELDKTKSQVLSEREAHRKIQTDLDGVKVQLQDMQRTERVVRVDLEQMQKKNERLRSRVIQLTFSTPAVKAPEKEISDDELIESLKQIIDERTKLLASIKDLEFDIIAAKSGKEELLVDAKKLRQALELSANRLKENGRLCGALKEEITVSQSLNVDENLVWVRDLFCDLLKAELDWETLTENALEKCGLNVKISNNNPSQHIEMLFSKWESSLSEVERLKNQITVLEQEYKADLEMKLNAVKTDMTNIMQDAIEKTKLKGEQDLSSAIDEIKAAEKEKRDSCLEAERRKTVEVDTLLEQMRKSFEEHKLENKSKLEEASQALQQFDALKMVAEGLKGEVEKGLKQLKDQTEESSLEKEELLKKFQSEHTSYEEQIKQHSVTICAMEEKLTRLVKEKKSLQDQLSKVKAKPAVPPKVIVQRPREEVLALEHVVNALRQENTVLKKEIMDSQGVIMALRRDLAGTVARLSDVSGDLSETQKQEMERNRELLSQKGTELSDLRQQMVKLSKIIDSQKEEIKQLETELSKEKTTSKKYRCRLEENSDRVGRLEDELGREKEEQKKQLELLECEGRITSELTSLGAQCRGERHDQVIARQREALSELRAKIKTLEQSRPPLSTEDQALQKIMHLQRELAELRKNQALSENAYILERSTLDKEVGRSRAHTGPFNAEAEMERSAHRETMDALECSEASYLSLCRYLTDSLNVEDVGCLASLAHIPKDEREQLMEVRRKACQLLAGHIEALKERLARNDGLLEDYESQLAQLKASLVLEERRGQELDELRNKMRSRAEESEGLRVSLGRTRDRLNQEKRINSLIKDRKLGYNDSVRTTRHHHCKVEDPQDVVRKKQQSELLKRKNYEIKKLKHELSATERDLHDTQRAQNFQSDLIVPGGRCGPTCSGCPACQRPEMIAA